MTPPDTQLGASRSRSVATACVVAAGVVAAYVFVMNAWVCDDAFITLRTVDNWVGGYGLRWNPIERVQTYTHPLWMLLLAAQYVVVRDAWVAALLASLLCGVAALAVAGRALARVSPWNPALLVVLLVGSKAFVDFSSSGLENPLCHLLLAAVWAPYLAGRDRSLRATALLAALTFLARPDAVLLVLPVLAHVLVERRGAGARRRARDLTLGTSPAWLWGGFSLFYYGFVWPNTAYAKLATGLPRGELVAQGKWYFVNSLRWDPVTIGVIVLSLGLAFARGGMRAKLASATPLLYAAWVWWIGGDFMSGRFLAAPYLLACLSLLALPLAPRWTAGIAALVTALAVAGPAPPIASGPGYRGLGIDERGIADERGWYWEASALCRYDRGREPWPWNHESAIGLRYRLEGRRFATMTDIGYFGYFAGPDVTILDPQAIGDALLARLPVSPDEPWRPGHFRREVPAGYARTLEHGVSAIVDPDLRLYHERLALVVRAPLFAPARLREIARFNLGANDDLRERYLERTRPARWPRPWRRSLDWAQP